MKTTLYLFALLLTIGLLNSNALYGETSAKNDQSLSDDWDALFDDDQPDRDGRKPRRSRRSDRDGQNPHDLRPGDGDFDRGPRRGPGPDGYGRGGDRGGRGPRDGRGRGGERVDPQELMKFLHEYEPQLAQKLETLREEDPRKARRQIRRLSQLYAPVMRQMERHPEMGQLSLDRVRVHLKIKNQLRKSNKDNAAPVDAAQLKTNVDTLFDIIIAQEELRNQTMASRMENWADDDDRPERRGRDRDRQRDPQKRLQEQQANIQAWQSNKAQVVDQQVQRLLNKTRPFPWGRM